MAASLVAEHINQLRESGMSGTCIADQAGVAFSEVYHIIRGDRGYVLSDVARKILAVRPVPMLEWSPGRQVPSIGSARRIQALVALGHTQADLAAEIGCYPNHIPRIMRQPFVTVAFARAVDDVYRRLMFTPAPERAASRRSRARAQRAGWAPPLAWDEDTIDDPTAEPDLGRPVETREIVIDLRADGLSDARIAEVLNLKVDSVQQAARRYERKLAS
ncbi:hypothetical protein [Mycolicibacterium llatzerense]|uniref:hypothetical protein n=1 Tax=Mycolicibacterium llatzerense TaxID=280871 RepID=UPI0021B68218|nr:hypothetical protein [Mycolicibacterium llatzerense]MCT7369419.1 hypothetical protein [Mycolicibacterium llatzerense]